MKDEQASRRLLRKWSHSKSRCDLSNQNVRIWSQSPTFAFANTSSHGHCGVTRIDGDHFHVLNDESVELLVKTRYLSRAQRAQTWLRRAT